MGFKVVFGKNAVKSGGLTCPLCGMSVTRGQVLAHRVQSHGESPTGMPIQKSPMMRAVKMHKKLKQIFELRAIGHNPTLISQLHKSQHKQMKTRVVTGDQPYRTPEDWNPPRGDGR